ncbi:Pentatricopeptide repeat-containing protein [Sesamum alatum]|uniref:Pentatricopeptide repeat-containing protein n=1 Tax=Sesamum alatum TaxID=300844 RepID=A0AAE2CD27_9LAMI|nr:Pentatricopeptide repeat-containing protein [Sesamum alatum]
MIRKTTTSKSSFLHQSSSLWRNCTNHRALKRIHACLIVNGFNSDRSALREFIYAAAIAFQTTIDYAHQVFVRIIEPDLFMWNTMLRGSAQSSRPQLAVSLYARMEKLFIQPDHYTFPFVLKACTRLSWVDMGCVIHGKVAKHGFEWNKFARNALIYFHANCGEIRVASLLFDGSARNDVVAWEKDATSWNSIIVGLAFSGYMEKSISLFEDMRNKKLKPDEITFVGVLIACSHAGKVDEGRAYFNLMKDVYNIQPNLKHYGCMVDLFGRAGLLNEAFEFIDTMEFEPNAIIWRTLLGACRIHCNVELGRHANEQLLKLRRDESGDYVLLSNIYASSGEWCGVEDVRKLMAESGVKKARGFSLVDEENHELVRFLLSSKPLANARECTL